MRALIIPAICGLVLAACDQVKTPSLEADTPPPTSEAEADPEMVTPEATSTRPVAERKTAQIDWTQARQDFAARETTDTGMFEVASGSSPAVPILLPEQPIGIESTGENALQFRPLADGYFAVQKGENYDMVINGTDKLVARPGGAGIASDTQLKFEETITGAQVSFSRYGASYLVEFMCKDPATAAIGSCVSEAEAVAEVEKLLLAGTR